MSKCALVFPIGKSTVWLAVKKRKVGMGKLNGYGGGFKPEDRDNPKACACREFSEESGASTRSRWLYLVARVEFYESEQLIHDCFVYLLRLWEGELQETEEMGKPESHPIANLPFDRMMTADREWLAKIFRGEQFSAKVFYDAGNQRVVRIEYGPLRP